MISHLSPLPSMVIIGGFSWKSSRWTEWARAGTSYLTIYTLPDFPRSSEVDQRSLMSVGDVQLRTPPEVGRDRSSMPWMRALGRRGCGTATLARWRAKATVLALPRCD